VIETSDHIQIQQSKRKISSNSRRTEIHYPKPDERKAKNRKNQYPKPDERKAEKPNPTIQIHPRRLLGKVRKTGRKHPNPVEKF